MSVTIETEITKKINYAAIHLNKDIIVDDIKINNVEANTIVCRITAVPEFMYEYKKEFTATDGSVFINVPEIILNDTFYRNELIEAQEGQIKVEVYNPENPDHILGFKSQNVHVQPYLHWDGADFPDTLAGFMQPNDPLIQKVIKRAGEYAAAEGKSMCGYQCRSTEGVKKQAEYIYHALQDADIHYISAPASFENHGQKIRIPHQVLHDESKQGTCLDLAVLYATCLESVSLNAFVTVISGHAFAGVWLDQQMLSASLCTPERMGESVWNEVLESVLPVECTAFTDGKGIDFDNAVSKGKENMKSCIYMIDVAKSRENRMVPVYTFTDAPICLDESGENNESYIRQEFTKADNSKIALLRNQAMDVTAKNKLLNNENSKPRAVFGIDTEAFMNDEVNDIEIQALVEGNLKDQNTLRELYKSTKQNISEYGKSNLYMAIDELKWKSGDGRKTYHAVMYLCPAEIYRNGRGDYQIRIEKENIFFNPALKVMMEQGFHIDCGRLLDKPEGNYSEQIKHMNFLIGEKEGWEIIENLACIATYSIPNEAVINGLNDEDVLNHEIVRGILDGEMGWNNELQEEGAGTEDDGIYLFESDSSQKEIIKSGFDKKAQVVVGPAGNGKTQTVVNIMLEAIRRGQTVLFVSEKAPALEVAYEKLNKALNGLFNIYMPPGKESSADVVKQIRKTLDYLESNSYIGGNDDAEIARRKYKDSISYIENYYDVMSEKQECGKSLEELIKMYEKYEDCSIDINVDEICKNVSLYEAEDAIGVLAKVMEDFKIDSGRFADFIRYDNTESRNEGENLRIVQTALQRYDSIYSGALRLRKTIGLVEKASEKAALQQMIKIAKIFAGCPVLNKGREEIMASKESDESFKSELIAELKKLSKRTPAFTKKFQKDKCLELLRSIYSFKEAESILADCESRLPYVLEKIEKLDIVRNNHGLTIYEGENEDRAKLNSFLSELDECLADEDDQTSIAVRKAADTIIEGKGWSIKELGEDISAGYKRYAMAQKSALKLIGTNMDGFAKRYPDLPKKVLFEEWIANKDADSSRTRGIYDGIIAEMESKGYGNVIDQLKKISADAELTKEDIMSGFYKAWALYHIDSIQNSFDNKCNFSNIIFQGKVSLLNDKESIIRDNLKCEIVQMHIDRVPNMKEGVSNNRELGTLQKLVRKRNITIRNLFEEVPEILHTLCPCMIMTPTAVAEYIPSNNPKFDLVIIDEGSQMPTYNALVPIASAERCMIFGDEKQLQPINDFRMKIKEDMDEAADMESILTSAYITSMPRKKLRFHYRSEEESLIAFSNEYYYNNDIMTFPSCRVKDGGVSYEFVDNGLYDREGSKANEPEAKRVVSRIREVYENLPGDTNITLGVITLNVHQRNYIQKLLLDEVSVDSELGARVDELVDVVNLESCQGKEWDYVIVSPGFARDRKGKLPAGFGALNKEAGANRLNVMLTRARKKMMVITSLEPGMLMDANSEGVKNFKDFLLFAKGSMTLDSRVISSGERESGMVDHLAKAIEAAGYEVHVNIGCSDFKVDLGVVSKDDPGKYVMGILLDRYKDTRNSIHDREITYPRILEKKGWNIYRLRDLNWVYSPKRELRQIIRELEQLV